MGAGKRVQCGGRVVQDHEKVVEDESVGLRVNGVFDEGGRWVQQVEGEEGERGRKEDTVCLQLGRGLGQDWTVVVTWGEWVVEEVVEKDRTRELEAV